MKIGIIGAGKIGATAAWLFVEAGHEVAIANSRGPKSLQPLVTQLASRAKACTVNGAATFGDVVLLAFPWRIREAMPNPSLLQGKIVVDAMNPYTATGHLYELGDSTSSEEVMKSIPGARLVKAFNTIYHQRLAHEGRKDLPCEQRLAIFLAGDDLAAKQTVAKLIEEIGFAPVDTGSLRDGGRIQEPHSPVYDQPLTAAEARRVLQEFTGRSVRKSA
jgi:predicted dinucleotide-binding enzyme